MPTIRPATLCLVALLPAFPAIAVAQDCFAVMDEICGVGQSITDCAYDGSMWNYVPDYCVGDFQTAIENEAAYYNEQAQQGQMNDWTCADVMDNVCGAGQSITDCAYDGTMWNSVPDECIGDFQIALENEAAYYNEQAQQQGGGSGDCVAMMDQICGAGQSITDCAYDGTMWNYVPDVCIGDFQTAIENEREYYEQQAGDGQAPAGGSGALTGYSYGGNLRTGPDDSYPSVAVLAEGDWLDIVENSGVYLDGYAWFYVRTPHGEGYQWGGIICSEGGYIDGVYSTC
jgi:thiamine pyrophosphokinase